MPKVQIDPRVITRLADQYLDHISSQPEGDRDTVGNFLESYKISRDFDAYEEQVSAALSGRGVTANQSMAA